MDEEKASLENEEKRFDLELDLDLDILSDNIAGDISTQHIFVKNHFQNSIQEIGDLFIIFYTVYSESAPFVSDENGLCSDLNAIPVSDVESCRSAATIIDESYFHMEENEDVYPKGCYLFVGVTRRVYFNHHSSGLRNKYSRHICKESPGK